MSLVTAGHSVGELAAAAIAGVLTPDAAVALAAVRGREMAAACALEPTGMSAVLGGNPDEVLARLEELGLDPANRNGAGQVVAAGLATRWPRSPRTRLRGPGWCRWPSPARSTPGSWRPRRQALGEHAAAVTPADPDHHAAVQRRRRRGDRRRGGAAPARRPGHPARALGRLPGDAARAAASTALIELPPAGTLVGLARRELKGVRTLGAQDTRRSGCRGGTGGRATSPGAPDERPAAAHRERAGCPPARAGQLPAGPGRHQRRARRPGRDERRVDPLAGRHREPAHRGQGHAAGRHGRRRGRPRAQGLRARAGGRSARSSSPPARCSTTSRTPRPRSRTGSGSRRPPPSTSTPRARASATGSASRRTSSGRARSGTSW